MLWAHERSDVMLYKISAVDGRLGLASPVLRLAMRDKWNSCPT